MAEVKDKDVHLETMEESTNKSEEFEEARHLKRPSLPVGKHPIRLLAGRR